MDVDPLVRLRRLLGEQWSPQWRPIEAIAKACDEIERLKALRPEVAASSIVAGECEECGQKVLTPLKHFPDTLKNAERYRWLNAKFGLLLELEHDIRGAGRYEKVRLRCGEPLDRWIDGQIEAESRREPQSRSPE